MQNIYRKFNSTCNHALGWLEPQYKQPKHNLILKTMTADQFCSWMRHRDILKVDYSQFQKNYLKSEHNKPNWRKFTALPLALYEIAFKATMVSLVVGVIIPVKQSICAIFSSKITYQHKFIFQAVFINLFLISCALVSSSIIPLLILMPFSLMLTIDAITLSIGHIEQGIGHLISLFDDIKGLYWIQFGALSKNHLLDHYENQYKQQEKLVKIYLKSQTKDSIEQIKLWLSIGQYAVWDKDKTQKRKVNELLKKACSEILKDENPKSQLVKVSKLANVSQVVDDDLGDIKSFFQKLTLSFESILEEIKNEEEKKLINALPTRIIAHEIVACNPKFLENQKSFIKYDVHCKGNNCACKGIKFLHDNRFILLEQFISETCYKRLNNTHDGIVITHVRLVIFNQLSSQEKSSYLLFLNTHRKDDKMKGHELAGEVFKELLPHHADWIKTQKEDCLSVLLSFKEIEKNSKLKMPKVLIKLILVELVKKNLNLEEEDKDLIKNMLF